MNLLIFVSALLMIVGILTYARVESYRNFSIMQSQFENYMSKVERKFINGQNSKLYDDIIASKGEKSKSDKENNIKADSKLTFLYFINKEKRLKNPAFQEYYLLAKKLMQYLYSGAEFYREASERIPDLPDQILTAIINAADKLPEDKQIKETKDLANLDLEDPILNDVFTKMLKGTDPEKPKSGWKRFIPEKGYLPLLSYISLDEKPQIRVYLATPPILMILFNSEDIVNQVINTREELYKKLSNDSNLKAEDLYPQFAIFNNYRDAAINGNLLNFQISKSDPTKAK